MKILMITPYMKPIMGGISTYVEGLCAGLREQDAICTVIAEKGRSTVGPDRIERSPMGFLCEGFLAALAFKPHIIHVHSNWRGLTIALAYKRLFKNTPVFFTFHTDYLAPLKSPKREMFESMLGSCTALVFTSSYLRSMIEASLTIEVDSHVLYAGVSGKQATQEEVQRFKEELCLQDKYPLLLYTTPFVWREKVSGIEVLASVIRDLERPGLSPHLLVIGDGPLLGPIKERLANCGLEDTVHFLGRVEDPWVAISACDIYTHISKRESLSISILEAMSVGKPVIATDVGGTREILSDESHGLTVDPHLRDMKAMLLSLSNDKERMRQLALNARRRVETTFSRRLSAMNHLRLYGEALRRNQE